MANPCSGNCGSCGGCAKELVLTNGELEILGILSQIPFLPIARRADDMTPVYLEDPTHSKEEAGLILACLEKKGLVDLDYRQALAGFDYHAYEGFPCHGSVALTARGHAVVELLELQGYTEE